MRTPGLVFAALILGLGLRPQQPHAFAQDQAVFRSMVQAIEVDVRVTDRQGRMIRDLAQQDFTILEDGRPQAITSFTFVDLDADSPVRGMVADAVESDTATNAGTGRMWVLLLGGWGERARLVARQFIQGSLGPHDEVAVVSLHGTMSSAQGFTRNRRLLLASIDRLPDDPPLRSDADSLAYRILEDLCRRLGQIGGRRKSVIFFDPPKFFAPSGSDHIQTVLWFDQRDAIRAATRNNVAIHVVSTEGLTTELTPSRAFGSLFDPLQAMAGQRVLAEETGGAAIVNSNNYKGAFERFVRDTSAFYVLTYTPTIEHRDGEFHSLTVRVNRPGVVVRARPGYYAPEAEPRRRVPSPEAGPERIGGISSGASDALRLPLSLNGLQIDLGTAPFRGTGADGSVVLSAQISDPEPPFTAGVPLEVAFQAHTNEGEITPGRFYAFDLNLTTSRDAAEAHGLRFVDRLTLSPGRYQIRLVAHQANGRTGMVVADVEVPDFTRLPLSLSGLLLTSHHTAAHTTLHADDDARSLLGGNPTAVRVFERGDLLTVFTEAYTNPPAHSADLRARATMAPTDDRGGIIDLQVQTSTPHPGRTALVTRVPLADVAPGIYVLTFEVRAGQRTASRQVRFTVTN